jgi:tRNA A-37 threonylcarbamoyl transferase component Bud32
MTPVLSSIIQDAIKEVIRRLSERDLDQHMKDQISRAMGSQQESQQEAPVEKSILVAVTVSTEFRTFISDPGVHIPTMIKGRHHRYIKREPTGKPKPKWRYWYKIPSKTALVHDEKLHVGSKFVFTTDHEGTEVKGHYEVLSGPDADGKYKIKHDETGGTLQMTAKDIRRMIHKQHRSDIVAQAKRLFESYEASLKYGTDKQKKARKKDLLDFSSAYFHGPRVGALLRRIEAVEEKHAPKAPGFVSPGSPYPRGVPTEFDLGDKPGVKMIGHGGFGRVYHDKGPPPAAVKYGEVKESEYEYGQELGDAGITPRVYNYQPSPGEGQGPATLAMEFLEGYKTQNWWENTKWNPYETDDRPKLAKMEANILRAIIKMGSRGFAHFDLHDENVMINDAGDVKIIDLGQMETSYKNVALELLQHFRMRNRFTEGFDTDRVMKNKVRRAFNNFASETGAWRVMRMSEYDCREAVEKFYKKVEQALDSGGL